MSQVCKPSSARLTVNPRTQERNSAPRNHLTKSSKYTSRSNRVQLSGSGRFPSRAACDFCRTSPLKVAARLSEPEGKGTPPERTAKAIGTKTDSAPKFSDKTVKVGGAAEIKQDRLDNDGGSGATGGNGDGGDGEGWNGGNGGGDDEERRMEPAVLTAELEKRGLTQKIHPGLLEGLMTGRFAASLFEAWLDIRKGLLTKGLAKSQGFLERMLGDKMFLTKVGIECGVGFFTKSAAEKTKRGDQFWNEMDFVAANVLMAIIADFMLVWLPAPTVPLTQTSKAAKMNRLSRFLKKCPDNAFQKSADRSLKFSPLQRAGAVFNNGAKLMAVGLVSSFISTTVITTALVGMRKLLTGKEATPAKTGEKQKGTEIPLVQTCACYGAYMATSSNIRYQMLAGFEQRVLENMIKQQGLLAAVCFALRTGNTFLGSLLWVDFSRLCGVTPKKEKKETAAA